MSYEEDFYGQDDGSDGQLSVDSQTRKRMKKIVNVSIDKHLHKIMLGNKKMSNIFSSGDIGSPIRNAVTGQQYNYKHRVGSAFEDLYFRVSYSIGNERKKLFFESPEQYERNLGSTIKFDNSDANWNNWNETKRAWNIKKMALST